ncbi:hypothetical protein BaRGS_00017886 [Batillaria attramentaria]|uniref:Lipocalin/cytosolic fatty-acid binding domain-containing protein n=1 Tax=Batillaria attramentaria TaxID=370345 RepID=A0ABD0KUI6_9CAEN
MARSLLYLVVLVAVGIVQGGPGKLNCGPNIPANTNFNFDDIKGDWHYLYLATDSSAPNGKSAYISIGDSTIYECSTNADGTHFSVQGSYTTDSTAGVMTFTGMGLTLKYYVLAVDKTSILASYREGISGGYELVIFTRPPPAVPDFDKVKAALEAFCGASAGDTTSYTSFVVDNSAKCP